MKAKQSNPGVYVFLRRAVPIYVGCTHNLDKRPKKRDRGHESRWCAILEATGTELIPCESYIKAQQLEEQLIRSKHPIYNLRTPRALADIERTSQIIRDNW